jgi:hypothetical protein
MLNSMGLKRFLVLLLASFFASSHGFAQESTELNFREFYAFGLHSGTLLPSKISGIKETLPHWGLRFSLPTRRGVIETDLFFANAEGVTYSSATLDFRLDIRVVEELPLHFLVGVHVDNYQTSGADTKVKSGWHYGGGLLQHIAGPVFLRSDFKYRYGPGTSVQVGLGILWLLGGTTSQ